MPLPRSAVERRRLNAERPLKQIKCLLPLWGYAYVRKFLDISLLTWLADGNLPALARSLPTEFVLLTSREDEMYLRSHPNFKRLSQICDTRIKYIDHLITGHNYSTTITLAYTEAVRDAGQDLLDTCFFFLVSDYIVADNSFRSVLERMQAGASGIQVGNFQVVEEEALSWLIDVQRKDRSALLSIEPRRMMSWALANLHPATVANTVNYPMNHNDHTNRLFWRVDNRTLIGRFYLMHMIAIRPELVDFVIGSSCDYSFIPEMCPSNNVEIIADSDDYLVIEAQPRSHESNALKPGPHIVSKLAKSLSEWTTARHRENSQTTVVFHAGEIPTAVTEAIASADEFIGKVVGRMRQRPRPHRGHPYWTGAIASFNESTGAALSDSEWRLALGLSNPELSDHWLVEWIEEKVRFAMFGKPPYVRPWHPRYPDYSLVLGALDELGLGSDSRLLLVSDIPTLFTTTFADGGDRAVRLRSSHMLKQPYEVYEPLHCSFDACLMEIGEHEFEKADELLDRIAPMMRDGCPVLISIGNQRADDSRMEFQNSIGFHGSRLQRPYCRAASFRFVTAGSVRYQALHSMISAARRVRKHPLSGIPLMLLKAPFLLAGVAIGNRGARVENDIPPKGHVSSILMKITIDAECARDAHLYSNSRILRGRRIMRMGLPEGYRVAAREDVGKAPSSSRILTGGTEARVTPAPAKGSEPQSPVIPDAAR